MPRPARNVTPLRDERQVDLLDVIQAQVYAAPTLDRVPTTGAQAAAGGLDCQPPQRSCAWLLLVRPCELCAHRSQLGLALPCQLCANWVRLFEGGA